MQAPGGRDNAKVVSKKIFQDMSLPDPSGNFFLSPAGIVGAFLVDPKKQMKCGAAAPVYAADEAAADMRTQAKIKAVEAQLQAHAEMAATGAAAAGFATLGRVVEFDQAELDAIEEENAGGSTVSENGIELVVTTWRNSSGSSSPPSSATSTASSATATSMSVDSEAMPLAKIRAPKRGKKGLDSKGSHASLAVEL